MSKRTVLSWSGGKDAAMALSVLKSDPSVELAGLLTTVTADYDRISMHGVRRELLEAQAESVGLPLSVVSIPRDCGSEEYEKRLKQTCLSLRDSGVTHVAFGDLFLEGIREYRERNLSQVGLEALFPLWGSDTRELSRRFIADGFRAIITCVDAEQLDGSFAGREYDSALLTDLPAGVDPCGENGEFHTFVYDGPVFNRAVEISRGEVVVSDGRFWFCDLIPAGQGTAAGQLYASSSAHP